MLKPLDIVRTPGGGMAIVNEVGERNTASITYINDCNPAQEHNAWWDEGGPDGLVVIDNLPRLLANRMAHPFGHGTRQGDQFFPIGTSNEGANS